MVYVPLSQAYQPHVLIVAKVRPGLGPSDAVTLIENAIRREAPVAAVGMSGAAPVLLSGGLYFARMFAILAGGLGGTTMILALIGLYALQSCLVLNRAREIGIRLAVGATAGQIRRMVIFEGLRPALQGLGIGIVIGLIGRAIIRSTVAGSLSVWDGSAITFVAAPLIVAAYVASYVPAARASRIEPSLLLREL